MSTPISWIRLERYHLGEVDAEERARIESVLAGCAQSQERLAQIRQDARPLPALPEVTPRRSWTPWAGGLALAAAALLAVSFPSRNTTKGGDLALTLVRERSGEVTVGATDYQDGDRFSVWLTCPAGEVEVAVQITQDGKTYTPLSVQAVSCGNRVPLSGAFAVTGPGDLEICADLEGEEVCERVVAVE